MSPRGCFTSFSRRLFSQEHDPTLSQPLLRTKNRKVKSRDDAYSEDVLLIRWFHVEHYCLQRYQYSLFHRQTLLPFNQLLVHSNRLGEQSGVDWSGSLGL